MLTSAYASRLVAGIENRLGESLGLKFDSVDWAAAAEQILSASRAVLDRQRERLVGEDGLIASKIESVANKVNEINDDIVLQLLISLSTGVRKIYNPRTHKQENLAYQHFNYGFIATDLIKNHELDFLVDKVLNHLKRAEQSQQNAWGQNEYNRSLSFGAQQLADFGYPARNAFGEKRLDEVEKNLSEKDRQLLIENIGRYALNEVRRQLILSSITGLWVDYLTHIESLRISIGLEAYAQRDPLVQYKSRASELFQQLLSDIRSQVVSRIFNIAPYKLDTFLDEAKKKPVETIEKAVESGNLGKRKRRRN